MITLIGCFLLPLCCWYWRRPAVLLSFTILFCVFAAAAVFVVGGLGVQPALLPATMFIGLFLLNILNGVRYPGERSAFRILLPFILVMLGALASSLIMPRLFMGEVLVWPQRLNSFSGRTPLAPNIGNFTQDMYLIVNTLLAVTATLYLTRSSHLLTRLLDVYFVSGLIVIGITIWQFAGTTLHVPFPAAFFLSNPSWAQLDDETIGSLIRLNGPFPEPAPLAGYMSASLSAAGWLMMNGDRGWLTRANFFGGIIVVLLSTAATGYVTLAGMTTLLILRVTFLATPRIRRKVFKALIIIGLIGGTFAVVLPLFVPGSAKQATIVLDSVLNKKQSESYKARSQADSDSIQEMVETYGLGVGWGSNRSSSLLPGLCAAIGAWGIAGVIWFGITVIRHARQAMRTTNNHDLHRVIRGTSAALISSLISLLLSGPVISSPDFYVLLAMLVAASAQAQFKVNQIVRLNKSSYGLSKPIKV